jgi:hypothetical protein
MTVAEARRLLARMPDSTPLCFADGEFLREVAKLDLVAATSNADYGFVASFDGTDNDSVRVAVLT